ncbi:MAG: DUF2270 domain-containing protein [Planctomycetota bacterium]
MAIDKDKTSFEDTPLVRSEYIAAMVHLYRGEQHRAQIWRTRLDVTTNWAVVSIGALLSYSFSQRSAEGSILLVLGMYMIFTMLFLESRRFRFYDVWRTRVRRIEENFYVPILRRDLTSPVENWGFYVAQDLLTPTYKISFLAAMKARLMSNYLLLFFVLLAAWCVKVWQARSLVPGRHLDVIDAIALAGISPWFQIAGVGCIYGFIIGVVLFVKRSQRPEEVYFGNRTVDSLDDVG